MFTISSSPLPPAQPLSIAETNITKKKRRPAGTPDPDAEVVSLSPRTLLESDRYVCEICNQGFQRDQNLQMHRRRHKVPWKLLKRESTVEAAAAASKKRVFVCPETSCLHHDPCHALGDLVGIKKHFRRKHSANKQWACGRCSKAYAVHSDYKAHLKTCGTRGHSCDCGRVFSRVESFIEHQDTCSASRRRSEPRTPQQITSLSRPISSPSPSTDTPPCPPPPPYPKLPFFSPPSRRNFELQLLAPPSTELDLSIGPPVPINEKSASDEAREQARQQVEMAEKELATARRIRQQARAEFEKACALRAAAARQINSILLQITCHDCQQRLRSKAITADAGEEGEQMYWPNVPQPKI
ncbi:protein indeterminate-domain 14 [Dendrobium catenatum]|uniref:Zinc finger protein JACKDAW n=1 Tax=Dendrobium catenatum TaxID=906689 RepID=A0A2I0XBA6_9ASPA|nr:protein indeterminate-domain 14 [Dendrobium catenatum]PKU85193.1 Zinc finger protein JACKDAW [Dendrobium catenatum]